MKQYLFYCAIISAVALINGYSIELDNIELLSGEFFNYDDHRITDEQRKCVEDGINKIKDENANLKPWFDDIEKTANTITKLSEKCYALNGVAQKICFKFLGRFVSAQRKRLFGNLTEEQKEVLDNVKKILKECLKEETAPGVIKIPFDDNDESEINVKEFLEMRFNFFPSNANTEEQINCIKEGYIKIINENPELQAWFEEVEAVSKKLMENAQECEAQSGLNQLKCYAKLINTARQEIIRLANLLSEAQKEILKGLADVIKNCLSVDAFPHM